MGKNGCRCCPVKVVHVGGSVKDHSWVNSMAMRSRAKVWIVQGGKLAKTIWDHCFRCKYLAKGYREQLMGAGSS
jgi:hypothetical protein